MSSEYSDLYSSALLSSRFIPRCLRLEVISRLRRRRCYSNSQLGAAVLFVHPFHQISAEGRPHGLVVSTSGDLTPGTSKALLSLEVCISIKVVT